jgi:hypothetical protein
MRFRLSDMFTAWSNNVGFTMSHMGPDVPFIAIPLDYHFEQEHFMGHRLGCYGIGESMTMRDHTPQAIAGMARQLMARQTARVEVDPGVEVAKIVLDTAREDRSDRQG